MHWPLGGAVVNVPHSKYISFENTLNFILEIFSIGSGNGLVPRGTKTLPDTYTKCYLQNSYQEHPYIVQSAVSPLVMHWRYCIVMISYWKPCIRSSPLYCIISILSVRIPGLDLYEDKPKDKPMQSAAKSGASENLYKFLHKAAQFMQAKRHESSIPSSSIPQQQMPQATFPAYAAAYPGQQLPRQPSQQQQQGYHSSQRSSQQNPSVSTPYSPYTQYKYSQWPR